ncbi:MAG TPA: zf-HC2 domain-containing protein [Chloroflexota bacterium]
MDHMQFKANQTAAGYVANGLDESTQEAFELHMMGCPECVEDVEVWRAIKLDMPKQRPEVRTVAPRRRYAAFSDWRMAASLVGAGVIGAAGGWLGKATTATDLDSTRTVVFNLPAVSRGADECTAVRLAPDTRLAVLRVPGIPRDLRVVALDSEKRELPTGQYASRIQPDGSQLLRIDANLLAGRAVQLEARRSGGSGEPLGCVTGATSTAAQ